MIKLTFLDNSNVEIEETYITKWKCPTTKVPILKYNSQTFEWLKEWTDILQDFHESNEYMEMFRKKTTFSKTEHDFFGTKTIHQLIQLVNTANRLSLVSLVNPCCKYIACIKLNEAISKETMLSISNRSLLFE